MSLDSHQTIQRDFKDKPFRFRRCFGTKQYQNAVVTLSNDQKLLHKGKSPQAADQLKFEAPIYQTEISHTSTPKEASASCGFRAERIVTNSQQELLKDGCGCTQDDSFDSAVHSADEIQEIVSVIVEKLNLSDDEKYKKREQQIKKVLEHLVV